MEVQPFLLLEALQFWRYIPWCPSLHVCMHINQPPVRGIRITECLFGWLGLPSLKALLGKL